MAKQDIVLKDVEIPDGYEATGEYRRASGGEHSLNPDGFVRCFETGSCGRYIILRKNYVPPSWIKPGTWLMKDQGSDMWFLTHYPGAPREGMYMDPSIINFTPPPHSPYQVPLSEESHGGSHG